MADFAYFVDGLDVDLLEGLDDATRRRKAAMAINRVARDARVEIARRIRAEVNLPASYVSPSSDRLSVTGTATANQLETRITARGRPTSLARFVTRGRVGRAGVGLQVEPGRTTKMNRAFLLPLPAGSGMVDTARNMGLAIRLRRGERLKNKYSAKQVSGNLYLLYGPSVSQVFEANSGKGVKRDIIPELEDDLRREFLRLLGEKNA